MAYQNNWGRRYSYGVMAPISVPALRKDSVPTQLQKGHLHFGSGADFIPKNIPVDQPYNVTSLRKSTNRAHDSLQPPPQSSDPAFWKMNAGGYKENMLASHQSRFEIFPTWKRDTYNEGFQNADIDIEEDVTKSLADELSNDDVKLPPLETNYNCEFFSKHRTITSFSERNPSVTPALMTRCGRRPADWHLTFANHTIGR